MLSNSAIVLIDEIFTSYLFMIYVNMITLLYLAFPSMASDRDTLCDMDVGGFDTSKRRQLDLCVHTSL